MFEDATFDSRSADSGQTPKWMLLALAVNLTLLSSLAILPLIYPESLPAGLMPRALYVPPPAPAAVAQTRPLERQTAPAQAARHVFTAPILIPTLISVAKDDPLPQGNVSMPVYTDGVTGGSSVADSPFHGAPRPAVRPAPAGMPGKPIVSQGVLEGLLISRIAPVYPSIALHAGISGTVVLAATISRSGEIENLRVVSGPEMLRQAARDAVQRWRYRPYLLNNQPVEVETTIDVVFSLGNR